MAGGRPATGHVRWKKGRVYASLPPIPGQPRDEVPFGHDVDGARRWVDAAMAARRTEVPVPDPRAFGARRALRGGGPDGGGTPGRGAVSEPSSAAAPRRGAVVPAEPSGPPPVAHLAHAYLPGRGHDINEVFRLFMRHYYRNLEAADADREVAVEQLWDMHVLPFLQEHARAAHGTDVFCVEELSLVLAGQLRSRLMGRGVSGTGSALASTPPLVGAVTVKEATALTGASKSTIKRRLDGGSLPGAERVDGVWTIPLEDLRQCGLLAGEPLRRGRPRQGPGLGTGSTGNVMWVLAKVMEFSKNNGVAITGDPTAGMSSKRSRKRTPRAERTVVSLGTTRALSAHMHVVHQAVLWLMRLLGMRISEVYGIRVADVLDDGGRYGVVRLRAQGGRKFLVRRGEDLVQVDEKEQLKNGESYRGIVVTGSALALIRGLIHAFHTAPDGTVDAGARLVPGIQAQGKSGQGGFRDALSAALSAERVSGSGHIEDRVVPHDLRKGLTTDLQWSEGLNRTALLRLFGHAPGNDVHGLAYTLDKTDHAASRAVADRIDELVRTEVNGLTVVPTAKEPTWGRDHPIRGRLTHVRGALAELGWLAVHRRTEGSDTEPLLDSAQVASLLGRPVSTVRTWLATGVIRAERQPGPTGREQWYATLADIEEFGAAEAAKVHLSDVAQDLGVPYQRLYATVNRMGIELPRDQRTGELLVPEAAREALAAEFARMRALQAHSESVAHAAARLGVLPSVVVAWVDAGRLRRHDEASAAASAVHVTRTSVDALVQFRGGTELGRSRSPVSDHGSPLMKRSAAAAATRGAARQGTGA